MKKCKLPHDATPDVHRFSGVPEDVHDIVNMYGTYNVQRTADTENVFPMIAPGLPKKYRDMKLGKSDVERLGETNEDRP